MKEPDQVPAVDPRRHPVSWRLTFSFSGETIRLARRQAVEMLAPASVGVLPKAGEHCGTWLELRDEKDRLLFVRRLYNPLQTLAEHHSPDGRIEVVTRPPGRGEFEAIVPALSEASSAVLMSSSLKDGRSTEPAREVARFPLREAPGGEPPDKPPGATGTSRSKKSGRRS